MTNWLIGELKGYHQTLWTNKNWVGRFISIIMIPFIILGLTLEIGFNLIDWIDEHTDK